MFTTVKLAKTSFTSHNYCVGVVILRVFKIYSQQLSGHLYSFVTGQYSHQQQFVKKCFSFLIGLPCFILYSKAKFACYSRCFLTSYFCIQSPVMKRTSFLGVSSKKHHLVSQKMVRGLTKSTS